jgi:RNA polymerase sigma factor (sigma-70 family)
MFFVLRHYVVCLPLKHTTEPDAAQQPRLRRNAKVTLEKKDSFWQQNNKWWTEAAPQMMATGTDGQRLAITEWDEANRRLWCLSYRVLNSDSLRPEDRADLVQEVLLKLQDPALLTKLSVVEAPAHYLAEMMRNWFRMGHRGRRRARRAMVRCAKRVATSDTTCPDQEASQRELCTKVRFIVNHILRADDRKVLWWFYKDELSVAEISRRLGISETAALQRLSRARKRLRDAFEG